MMSLLAETIQNRFDSLLAQDPRPLYQKSVGRKPGKPKRTQIVGASVTDVNQVNPTDGGVLMNLSYPLFKTISVDDINQGQLSDCYLLALLGALARTDKGRAYIPTIMGIDPTNPSRVIVTYTRGGLVTRVHCDLLVSTQFNQMDANDRDLWVELFEKTYAYFRSGMDTYASLNMGLSSAVASDLGCIPSGMNLNQGLATIQTIKDRLTAQVPCTMLTPANPGLGLVPSHAYTVMSVNTDNSVVLRNPWGTSGGQLIYTIPVSGFVQANLPYTEYGTTPSVVIPAPPVIPTVILKGLQSIANVPGKVLAGNFTRLDGSIRVEKNTPDSSDDLGYIAAGDQAFFMVQSASAKSYNLSFQCATVYPSSTFDVYIGSVKAGTLTALATGSWSSYTTCSLYNVQIPAGLVGITLVFKNGNLNVNNFTAT